MRLLLPAVFVALALPVFAHGHEGLHAEQQRRDVAVEKAPDDLVARLARADARRRAGESNRALLDVDHAAALAPDDPRVHALRGLVLLDLGRAAEAVVSLDRYLAAVRTPRTDVLTARASLERGVAALRLLDRAVAIAPSPDLCARRGDVAEAVDPAAASAGYRACAEALGGAVALRLRAVEIDRARGAFDAALGELDLLLATQPNHPTWLILRAEIREDAGRSSARDRAAAVAAIEARLAQRDTAHLRLLLARARGETP